MSTDLDRLASGLQSIANGSNTVDPHTVEQLTMLHLIERTKDLSYVLTLAGNNIIQQHQHDVKSTVPESVGSAEKVKRSVGNLIKNRYNDHAIAEAMGVNSYRTLGRSGNLSHIGRFLGKVSSDDVIPTATVLGDSIRVLNTVMEALDEGRNNKIFLVGGGMEQVQSGQLLRYAVRNYEQILLGEKTDNTRSYIDLSFIGNIPFAKFVEQEDFDEAVYYAVKYVLSGVENNILNCRIPGRRTAFSGHTLKSMIDAQVAESGFDRAKFNQRSNIVIVSEPIKGGTQWNKAFVRELERQQVNCINMISKVDPFLLLSSRMPCLFLNENGGSELRTSVESTIDFSGLPDRRALTIFGASEAEIANTGLRAFIARIVSHARIKPVGGGTFKPPQLEECSQHITDLEARKSYVLGYMLERCEGIDGSQLQTILGILVEFSVSELTDELILQMRKRTKLSDELVEKYSIRVSEYNPRKFMTDFPGGVGELITDNQGFFNAGAEHVGLGKEIDEIFESLEKGEPVVYIDETGYRDPHMSPNRSGGGVYNPIAQRVRTGMVQRMMSGDVPDSLRNHSIVLVEGDKKDSTVSGQGGLLSLLFGLVEQGNGVNLNTLRTELQKFIRYNPKTILILSLDVENFDSSGIGEFIRLAMSMGIKLVIEGKKDIPGTKRTVRTTPVTEDDLSDRIIEEIDDLQFHLGMDIDTRLCRKLFTTVSRYRQDGDDPLWMVHEILKVAKNNALGRGAKIITGTDVSAGISYVLGIASVESMNENRAMISRLPAILKKRIVGQDEVIDDFCREFMSHMTGGGNPERPLSYLFPGPTGVGKTLFAEVTSRNFNLPFLSIDGSQYTEAHTSQRLTSSPPGYVGSDKPGILTGFMEKNPGRAIVFVDEIDKMHPSVRMLLMNFFDEGKMTAGDGEVYRRPQYTIVVATNAGAERLRHGMTKREVLECIGEAFKDSNGTPKPELASRFRISPMLPVEEIAFKRAIRDNLYELELRAKMVANGVEVSGVTDEAIDFVFRKIREVCQKHNDGSKPIGFTPSASMSDGYFNLREIVRCIDANIDGENIPTKKGAYKVIIRDGKIVLEGNECNVISQDAGS